MGSLSRVTSNFNLIFPIFFVISTFTLAVTNGQATFQNPIFNGNSADPSVIKFGDFYYLTLSTDGERQISLFKSKKLTSFRPEDAEEKVIFRAPEGYRNVWASEMHIVNGEIYVYFCMYGSVENAIQNWVIQADNASDPMSDYSRPPIRMSGGTDATIFRHPNKDGNVELYYVWGATAGLWLAKMKNATAIEDSRLFLRGPVETSDWECTIDAVANVRQCIVEGPYFIYSRNVSYLVFSGGSTFGPDYSIGMMSLKYGLDPLNPSNWDFGENKPLFYRNDEESVYTTGHAVFVRSPDETELWIVYHASDDPNNANGNRVARINKMDFDSNGKPVFPRPTGFNHSIPVPSGQI